MHDADPALLTIAWATCAGLLAQLFGHRLRVPAIVPLLVLGIALGPSGLGVVQPESLGGGLSVIVKLAVAVILFDGALNLRIADLRKSARDVRRLVTRGLMVTWVGATLAAWLIARLSLPVAIVFGALMTVTGPTVVQPLLKRVPLPRRVKTVLEGEAILIDPIGAVLAVAVVDIILGISGVHPIGVMSGAWGYVGRLLTGLGTGIVGGMSLSWLLKRTHVVPGELVNLVTLGVVWAAFGFAEWMQSESGITAAVAMGLAMQRGAVPEERRLRLFKEQLTVLGISLLFVLLAADLPMSVVRAEGWRGLITVLVLMLVVRPISVAIALAGSTLTWRERAFVSWISPRGIVAASVASLFAVVLRDAGYAEGPRVLAISFLTIAITVSVQGLTANLVARLLGLGSLEGKGAVIVGAGPLGVGIATALKRRGRPVMIVDRNSALVEHARSQGLEAVEGNALDESVLATANAEEAETLLAVTTNSEVNALAAHIAKDAFGVAHAYPALADASRGAGPELLERVGGHLAFGRPVSVREWDYALEHGGARFLDYLVPGRGGREVGPERVPDGIIVVARARGSSIEITNTGQRWRGGDELIVLTRAEEAEAIGTLDTLHEATGGARRAVTTEGSGQAGSR